jgi:hypothetical protein
MATDTEPAMINKKKGQKMTKFEGTLELFDLNVRRLANGNKLRVILECPEDIDIEKKIIEFRGANVKVTMTPQETEGEKPSIHEEVFEVFDIKCRRLRNGDKLRVILECLYEKEKEIPLVKLRYEDVLLTMEKIQQDIFEKAEDDIYDVEEPED